MTPRIAHLPRGVVLVFVLWTVAVLAVICLALGGAARYRQAHVRRNRADDADRTAVRAAAELARRLVLEDDPAADTFAEDWCGDEAARFTVTLNGRTVRLLSGHGDDADDGPCAWGLSDESARLNANTATAEMLAALPGMTEAVAEAFVAIRGDAAAGGDALSDAPPGPTGPLGTPHAVRVALEVAFRRSGLGGDADAGDGFSASTRSVAAYLSVYTRQRNLAADGSARANLNTAGRGELFDRLGEALSGEQIDAILAWRDEQPFASIGELLLRERTVTDEGGDERVIRIDRAAFTVIADRITVRDEALLVGRVNVNTAPAAVLAALPGLSGSQAAALVEARSGAEEPHNVAWTLSVLDEATFAAVCEYLTTRTAQFRMWARRDTSATDGGFTHSAGDGSSAPPGGALAVLERDAGRCGVIFWSGR